MFSLDSVISASSAGRTKLLVHVLESFSSILENINFEPFLGPETVIERLNGLRITALGHSVVQHVDDLWKTRMSIRCSLIPSSDD